MIKAENIIPFASLLTENEKRKLIKFLQNSLSNKVKKGTPEVSLGIDYYKKG